MLVLFTYKGYHICPYELAGWMPGIPDYKIVSPDAEDSWLADTLEEARELIDEHLPELDISNVNVNFTP